ncbi:MAG: hypothetical protein HQK83_05445 [Fibrobacteria bacterium]|nr:hypothetical protein [Fibrobacteria bacterium]
MVYNKEKNIINRGKYFSWIQQIWYTLPMLTFLPLFILIVALPSVAATLGGEHFIGPAQPGNYTQAQGWVDVDAEGNIHVIYAGSKYRMGPAADSLGDAETFTTASDVWNARMKVDAHGVPHIVYQVGIASAAQTCWYTTRKDGNWITPKKVADAGEIGKARAFYPSIAVDSAGNVLVAHWTVSSNKTSNNVVHYRWRSPEGTWGSDKSLPTTSWKSTPKVRLWNGGFYLLYMNTSEKSCIAGPVEAAGTFSTDGICADNNIPNRTSLNEGSDFAFGPDSSMITVGGVRIGGSGPSGIFVGMNPGDGFGDSKYLGAMPNSGTKEGDIHAHVMYDDATGAIVTVGQDEGNGKSYFYVYENDAWTQGEEVSSGHGHQTCFRTGPSLADLPGRGLIMCYRSGDSLYLREISTEGVVNVDHTIPSFQTNRNLTQLHMLTGGVVSLLPFSGTGDYHLVVSDVTGRTVAEYPRVNKNSFSSVSANLGSGLYMFTFKQLE